MSSNTRLFNPCRPNRNNYKLNSNLIYSAHQALLVPHIPRKFYSNQPTFKMQSFNSKKNSNIMSTTLKEAFNNAGKGGCSSCGGR